jgi:hypothetical protein
MKKIGLIALVAVLAVGGMGIGYAAWTDTIYINGTVGTGSVCLEIEPVFYGETNFCKDSINKPNEPADYNWSGWIESRGSLSCPDGYRFVEKYCSDKDVAEITFAEVLDNDGYIEALEVTVWNAYPHFLGQITFEVCNCGTIPVKIKTPVIDQSPFLLVEFRDSLMVGGQLEDQCQEISFFIGVVQHEGYWDNDVWVVDDPTKPLLPMDTPLTFTIAVEAIQWHEYTGP